MKFKDFLSGFSGQKGKVMTWAKKFLKIGFEDAHGTIVDRDDWQDIASQHFHTDGQSISLADGDKVYYIEIEREIPPINGDKWNINPGASGVQVYLTDITIPNVNCLPRQTTQLFLSGAHKVVIGSLSGLKERLPNLESLHAKTLGLQLHGGVLCLLKHPNLKKIFFPSSMAPERANDSLRALYIVSKHLESKDVSECMDELIEAGLKEYAKL
jgi:hypothetical protein